MRMLDNTANTTAPLSAPVRDCPNARDSAPNRTAVTMPLSVSLTHCGYPSRNLVNRLNCAPLTCSGDDFAEPLDAGGDPGDGGVYRFFPFGGEGGEDPHLIRLSRVRWSAAPLGAVWMIRPMSAPTRNGTATNRKSPPAWIHGESGGWSATPAMIA